MEDNTLTLQTVSTGSHHFGDTLVERVAKRHVGDDTPLEERKRSDTLGTINDLVRDHKVAGLDLLLQAADGGEGNDGADANGTERGNVGAGRNLMRGDLVVHAMATEKSDCDGLVVMAALVVQDGDRRGGLSPGGRDVERGDLGEARKLTETSSTDDGDTDGLWKWYLVSNHVSWLRCVRRCRLNAHSPA